MKKRSGLLALAIIFVMLASSLAATAGAIGEPIAGYDDYDYYVYYDFQNYGSSSSHGTYMRNTSAKTADGLLCNPFGIMHSEQVQVCGTGKAVKEADGNVYYSFVEENDQDYASMGVFVLKSSSGNMIPMGESVELSFKFRLHETQTMAEGSKIPLVNVRRGSKANRVVHLLADMDGNLYANIPGNTAALVYTNSGDGEFMDIAFRWYDVSNTYSLYVNGEAILEAIPLANNYRTDEYVTKSYTDDFGVELDGIVGNTVLEHRAMELLRRESLSDRFGFDIDDIKFSRIESEQGGRVFYENDFDADTDGVSSRMTRSHSYVFPEGVTESDLYLGTEGNNGFLNVKRGKYFALKDATYQIFGQGSYVIEFSVKANTNHTSGYKSLVGLVDNNNVNKISMLKVGPDGSLYLESDENTRIEGYTLDDSKWLNVAIVATKNLSNSGKFGSFNSSKTVSSLDNTYSLSYYIDGNYVGTSSPIRFREWKIWTSGSTTYKRTSSNFAMDITHTEGTLDVSGLTKVADGVNAETSTDNHIIYKSANGLTYYDVEYAEDKTTQLRYSTMVLTNEVSKREDSLRFFMDTSFEGAVDNVRVYEGTTPDSCYDALNNPQGGVMLEADFGKLALSTASSDARTNSSGKDVLGTFISSGIDSQSIVRKTDENGTYATLSFEGNANGGDWFDFFVLKDAAKNGYFDTSYSFETTVKNIDLVAGSDTVASNVGFFTNRFEDGAGFATTQPLISVDSDFNLWAGNSSDSTARIELYDANGNRAKLDNSVWNTLKADIRLYSDGTEYSAELGYYLNGEILYLADGTPAYSIQNANITPDAAISKMDGTNYRLRYVQAGSRDVTLDVKSFKVLKGEDTSKIYIETPADVVGKVSEIEFTVPVMDKTYSNDYFPIVSIEKFLAQHTATLDLLYAELNDGTLAVSVNGELQQLYRRGGSPIKLSDTPTRVNVVYDDISGNTRIFVNDRLAYLKGDGEMIPLAFTKLDGALNSILNTAESKIILYSGLACDDTRFTAADYAIKLSTVNADDTAKIIGFQENSINDGVRILAGIDTLYYTDVGFEIETFEGGVSKGITALSGDNIFESVVADGKTITAKDQGYEYFAAAVITEISSQIADNSFILVRAFTEVDGIKQYDEAAQIIISSDGYSFGTRDILFENNFNNETDPFSGWSTNSDMVEVKNGELAIYAAEFPSANYYSMKNFGSGYVLQSDFRIISEINEEGYISLKLRSVTPTTYLSAVLDANGEWFIEAVDGNTADLLASGELGSKLFIGQTYTLSAICFADNVAFFVDGVFMGETSIPSKYLSGGVGIDVSKLDVCADDLILRGVTDEYDEKLIYTEDFEGLAEVPTEWSVNSKSSSALANPVLSANNNALRISDKTTARLIVDCAEEFSGDFVFEADLTAIELGNTTRYMGLVFGVQDDGDMIGINLRMSDGRIQSDTFDAATSIWTNMTTEVLNLTPAVNTTYKFKLVCENGFASFYIDGVRYAYFEIPERFLSGKVGVFLSQSIIDVDNVKLLKIEDYEVSQDTKKPLYEIISVPSYEANFDGLTSVPTEYSAVNAVSPNVALSIEDNALVIKDNASGIVGVTVNKTMSGNYIFEADLTFVYRANDGRYMGLLMGVQDDGSFITSEMRLNDNGRVEFCPWTPAGWGSELTSRYYLNGSLPLEATRTYHFKLECLDGYATTYIDGINCGSFKIPEKYLSGKVGFVTSQATIKVDNVKISEAISYELIPEYEADFDNYIATPTEWKISAGSGSTPTISNNSNALVISNETTKGMVVLDSVSHGEDFIYEVDIKMTEQFKSDSWWMGPIFGDGDDGSFVIADINVSSGGWYVEPWTGSAWGTPFVKYTNATLLTSFKPNTLHHLKLVSIAGKGTLSVNGVELASFDIPEAYRTGKVGVGFRNATVEVDNVKLYSLKKSDSKASVTLYDEEFDGLSSAPAEWSKSKGCTSDSKLTLSIQDEELRIYDMSGSRGIAELDKKMNGDFIFEADITAIQLGNSTRYMGLVIGMQDDGAFTSVSIRMSDGRISGETCTAASKWGTLSQQYASNIPAVGTKYNFRVEYIGGVATFYLDGVKYNSFTVPAPYTSGKVGIILSQSIIHIDNVKLYEITDPASITEGLSASAESLKDSILSLGENHVMHNKTLTLDFNTEALAEGQSIVLGHGKELRGGSWVEITATDVIVYGYTDSKTEIYRATHGLNISGNVKVTVDTDVDTANAKIVTDGGAYITPVFAWSGRDGEIFAESVGATLEDVTLNWVSSGLEDNVWIIGDSLDINDESSFAYYLGRGGLAMIGSYDETSTSAIKEFENALKHNIPEYAIWAIGVNDADSASEVNADWEAALDRFLALCKKHGIAPILTTTQGTSHSFKNSVVTASGYRYIDLAQASDAEAMYNRILFDFTEIKDEMTGTRIKVATYNTGNYTGSGISKGSADAYEVYREIIESTNADIWGLQEDDQFFNDTTSELPFDAAYSYALPYYERNFTGKYNGKAFLSKYELYDIEPVYYPTVVTSYAPNGTKGYSHAWFLTGKVMIDGKEISLVSLHLDWSCKERRSAQLQAVVDFAKEQEYCIVMGDFNPEDFINSTEITKDLFYEEELALFREIGMEHANAGKFGLFNTLVAPGFYGPWDNVIVSSNIEILSVERVCRDWMNDHAIIVAEIVIH